MGKYIRIQGYTIWLMLGIGIFGFVLHFLGGLDFWGSILIVAILVLLSEVSSIRYELSQLEGQKKVSGKGKEDPSVG